MEQDYKKKIVFISYPKDVIDLKNQVFKACKEFNYHLSEKTKYIIEPRDFTFIISDAGPNAQSLINKLIAKSDIFIGILWKRFGSPTGAVNPQTGDEYESGMREEFDKALDKKQNDNNFKICFFFKNTTNIDINTSEDAEQLKKVLLFKKELQDEHIMYKLLCENDEIGLLTFLQLHTWIDEFANKTKEITNIKLKYIFRYPKLIDNYLGRTVLLYAEATSNEASFLKYYNAKDIIEILEIENRVVLLADAGYGKSIELERLASFYSSKEAKYYPILIGLNLYTNEKIEELLPEYWKEIPEESLLVIMDGFDEIPSENKITAVREIEKFSEKYENCKMVISCRTNFYIAENTNYSGTLKSFTAYMLNELDWEESDEYITRMLNNKKDMFYKTTSKNKSSELLYNPFYLKFLVKKYLDEGKLPSSRNDIFEELIKSRIHFDDEHFRTTTNENPSKNKEIVFRHLKKIALLMETLCRNYITTKEYFSIVQEEKIRNILILTGIWNNRDDKWQFEHNSFQEYLAATALASVSTNKIKKFLSFPPHYNVVIPSWVNTLSFLLNSYNNSELKKWILKIQPELTIKFEPDRVNSSLKKTIFNRIFNNYKKKKIWIDRDKYNLFELAKFGECEETLDFLVRHININEYYTVVANAISLLIHMDIPNKHKQRIKTELINITVGYNNKYIKNDAMIALGVLKLNDKKVIEELFTAFGNSEDDWIRYGMYVLIERSDFLDEYIDYFLDGIKFYSDRFSNSEKDTRISNEFWHLESGLQNVKRDGSALKILNHLIAKPAIVHIIGFDRVMPKLMENIANIYLETNNNEIFQKICDLFLLLNKHYYKPEAHYCLTFFNKSCTRLIAFQTIYSQKGKLDFHDLFGCLANLSDKDCTEIIIKEYSEKKIEDNEIWGYQQNLTGELYYVFNKRINEVSGNKFVIKPPRDYNKENEETLKKDIELLFDKNRFLKEIELVFEKEHIEHITDELLSDIRYDRFDKQNNYQHIITKFLRDNFEEHERKKENVITHIKNMDWGYFQTSEIYNLLSSNQKIDLNNSQLTILKNWCLQNLKKVDFKTALKQEGKTTTASILSIILSYFLRHFKFSYPKETLLDMLSFDWHGVGTDYLEEFLTTEEMTERILNNLNEDKCNDYTLRNYFKFCRKHKVKSSENYAVKEILNSEREIDTRKLALDLIVCLGITDSTILRLTKKICDSFKWELIEILVKNDYKKVIDYLLDVLKHGANEEKTIASGFLMRMQNLEGLKFYTETLEREKRFVHNWHQQRAISSIRNPKALKYLLRLLILSYDKDLQEDKFDTLYREIENVLTNIALTNDRNFKSVYNAIDRFIKEHKKKNNKINFLNSYLERLERQFYFSKSQNISLSEALEKLKLIGM
jgi:predicted NACHT family NTPase